MSKWMKRNHSEKITFLHRSLSSIWDVIIAISLSLTVIECYMSYSVAVCHMSYSIVRKSIKMRKFLIIVVKGKWFLKRQTHFLSLKSWRWVSLSLSLWVKINERVYLIVMCVSYVHETSSSSFWNWTRERETRSVLEELHFTS